MYTAQQAHYRALDSSCQLGQQARHRANSDLTYRKQEGIRTKPKPLSLTCGSLFASRNVPSIPP